MPLTLKRKPIFSGFGGPGSALVRLLFQVRISGCVFNGFYAVFCDFGSPLGVSFGSLGRTFLGELAVSFWIGDKVAPGSPKGSLWEWFLEVFWRI